MNSKLKSVIIFLVGASGGALLGYKIAEKIVVEKGVDEVLKRADEENEKLRAYYEGKLQDLTSRCKAGEDKIKMLCEADPKKLDVDEMNEVKHNASKPEKKNEEDLEKPKYEKVDYTKFSKNPSDEEKAKAKPKVVETKPAIEYISDRQFDNDAEYDKVNLTYYAGSNTLVDDNEGEEDVDIVGEDFINHFGDYDEDVCYVRNNDLKIDYYIVEEYSPYSFPSDDD